MKKILVCILTIALILSMITLAVADEKPTVTIRFLLNGEFNDDTCADGRIFAAFAEKYANEVTLIPEWLPSEGQEAQTAKLRIMMQAGDAPGVVGMAVSSAKPFVEAGIIQDLNDIVDDEWKQTYLMDGVEDLYTVDGTFMGVPQQVGFHGWYYNKQLFDKCGLEIPKTFDDLLHCVEVFKENGIVPIAQSGMDSWSVWGYQYYFYRYGFEEMVEPILNHEMKFNNPELLKGFEKLQQLHEAGAFPENMNTLEYARAVEMFKSGEAAMFNSGTWEANGLNELDFADDIVFNWGQTFSDTDYEQNLSVKQVGQGMFACKTKDELETKWALEYIKFWAENEASQIMLDHVGWFPASKVQMDSSSLTPVAARIYDSTINDGTVPVTLEVSMWFPASFTTTYWAGVQAVINGNMTASEALDTYDEWNETRID